MSKQFYTPELGDKIKLAEDWEFTLHPEYRNQKFADYFGYDHIHVQSIGGAFIKKEKNIKRPKFPDFSNVEFPKEPKDRIIDIFKTSNDRYHKYFNERQKIMKATPEYQQYIIDLENYNKYLDTHKIENTKVTLLKNTELIVDRIYIRKNQKDYSSISFYAIIGGKKLRFWAKLEDCNKIIYY